MPNFVKALINSREPDSRYKELVVDDIRFDAEDSDQIVRPVDLGKTREIKLLLKPSEKEAQIHNNSRNSLQANSARPFHVSGDILEKIESMNALKVRTDKGVVFVEMDETIEKQSESGLEGKGLWTPVEKAEILGFTEEIE